MRFIQATTCFAIVAITLMSGCNLRPNFGPPGTIGTQRNRAVLHDPYPSTTMGPSIEGGRPHGFDVPMSEAKILQGSPFANRGSQPAPYTGF